jgi:hypothetical protein
MINTVRAILAAKMATWATTPISWPNTKPLTSLNVPWVRFSCLAHDRIWPMTGTKRILTGEVVVQIFAPSGSGDGAASILADSIGALFSQYASGGVQCDEPDAPTVIGDQDGWYQINASIPWRAEI